MNSPLYDSKALTLNQWDVQRDKLLEDGWEYWGELKDGVVYIRKHVSGEINFNNKWLTKNSC